MAEYKVTTQYRLQRDPHTGQLTGKVESKGAEITMTPANDANGNAEAAALIAAVEFALELGRMFGYDPQRECHDTDVEAGIAAFHQLVQNMHELTTENERLTRDPNALRSAYGPLLEFVERVANARLPFTANVIIEATDLLAKLSGSVESKTAPPDNE